MKEAKPPIKVGSSFAKSLTKKIAPTTAKLAANIKDGIITENKVPTMMLCFVRSSLTLLNSFNWLSSWTKDLTTRIPIRFSLAILLTLSISFWMIIKCLPILVNDKAVIKKTATINATMIHHNCGIVIIAKTKAPINRNGILKSDCKEIMTRFWICVISFVSRTTRFPAENFSIFPNEKVWILRNASSRISALIPCATFAEKIVFETPAASPNKAKLIKYTPIVFILSLSSVIIASNTCCKSFGYHNAALTIIATENNEINTATLYFFACLKIKPIGCYTPFY